MKIRHLLRRFVLMNAFEDEGGGGGAPAATPPADTPAPADTGSHAASNGPSTMFDAMFSAAPAAPASGEAPAEPAPSATLHRDEHGRFTTKPAADPNAMPTGAPAAQSAAAVPGQTAKPAAPKAEDDLVMPDGLSQKGQQRFQAMANELRELRPLRERADILERQTSYIKDSFREAGVQQPQFEQAVSFIGMVNRGDIDGAAQLLMGQLQQLSLISGKQYGAPDPLASFPDLRQKVDTMQITEADALRMAQLQFRDTQRATADTAQQQEAARIEQEQAAIKSGLDAIDAFVKQVQTTDIDYPAIEAQLLPEVNNLLKGLPPQMWRQAIETQYRLIKNVAGKFRQTPPSSSGNVLRPTGVNSAAAAPKSLMEAMFPNG